MNKILTVSQLNNYVKNVFDDELLLQNITVEGEVYECKFSGGNCYLTLKEGDYVLACVKFGSRLEFSLGDKIHVTGSMRFYPRGGRATFVINYASKVGKGELLVKLNELKDRLSKEGVFNNTKKLPRFIKKLALVTSTEGAVIHDFLEVLTRNGCDYIDIDVYGVKVQGAAADETIVKAIYLAEGWNYDAVVVARGGGSGQDLSCFNTESVARSVFGCSYPVISAIGHEVDYTLCDFAASIRAGTPSIAAELIVRNNEAFFGRFYECLSLMRAKAESMLSSASFKSKSLTSDLLVGCERKASDIKSSIKGYADKMFSFCEALESAAENSGKDKLNLLFGNAQDCLLEKEHALQLASAMLDRTSPLKILADGYAKVLKDGKSIDNAMSVEIGDNLKVIMTGGTLAVTVNDKEAL